MIDYQWWHDCYYCSYLFCLADVKKLHSCMLRSTQNTLETKHQRSSIVALSFAWESTTYFLEKTLKSVFFLLQWSVEKGQTAPHWPSMSRKSTASPATVKSTDQRDTDTVRERERSIWTAARGWASNLKSEHFHFSLFKKFIWIYNIVCFPCEITNGIYIIIFMHKCDKQHCVLVHIILFVMAISFNSDCNYCTKRIL